MPPVSRSIKQWSNGRQARREAVLMGYFLRFNTRKIASENGMRNSSEWSSDLCSGIRPSKSGRVDSTTANK